MTRAPAAEAARPRAPAVRTLHAMASAITLRVEQPGPHAEACLDRTESIFREVERTCSRFDATSALSVANAEPRWWHDAPATLAIAIREAEEAHRETGGLFDPRVLDELLAWGYDRSLPFGQGEVTRDGIVRPDGGDARASTTTPHQSPGGEPWRPQVLQRGGRWRINLDGRRIDLGGIGKGLAVRWAAAELAGAGRGYRVNAGGDGAFGGSGPDGTGWLVRVADPAGGTAPVLVMTLTDTACATSSTRLRTWEAAGERVHHLVDPRTQRPGGSGLAAVTVVAPDPARAEIWSKTLFLGGAAGIGARADRLGLAAAWIGSDGSLGTSVALDPLVLWRQTGG